MDVVEVLRRWTTSGALDISELARCADEAAATANMARAYRKMARATHPDKASHPDEVSTRNAAMVSLQKERDFLAQRGGILRAARRLAGMEEEEEG